MPTTQALQTTLAIEGLFCGGCASTVERALKRLPGVESVGVSFISDVAVVRHDPARSDVATLIERVAGLGYGCHRANGPLPDGAQRRTLREHQYRLAVAICFGMWAMLASLARYLVHAPDDPMRWWLSLFAGVFSLPVVLYSGAHFVSLAWRSLRAGVAGMDTLITLATLCAFGVSLLNLWQGSTDVFFDVPVMLIIFQLLARLTDFKVRRRAQDTVRSLLELAPDFAHRVAADGQLQQMAARELQPGDRILCRAGERLAADGIILVGQACIDERHVTGESVPTRKGEDDAVLAGSVLCDGTLEVRVTCAGAARQVDRLAAAVQRTLGGKSDLMRRVDTLAGWLLPLIILAALVAGALALAGGHGLQHALVRALAVLVISCPCALSLAIPLVIAGSAHRAARMGAVIRDSAALEQAWSLDTVVIDKTGTVTDAQLVVAAVCPAAGHCRETVLACAASAETGSNHPMARAVLREAARVTSRQMTLEAPVSRDEPAADSGETHGEGQSVVSRREYSGRGVETQYRDGRVLRAGSVRWIRTWLSADSAQQLLDTTGSNSQLAVAMDDALVGVIELTDTIRDDAAECVRLLHAMGLKIILASGDHAGSVQPVAETLGMPWQAGLLPEDKQALVVSLQAQGRRVAFVGDGLNDAPALAAADVGIAAGQATDLARGAAAASVLQGGLPTVVRLVCMARRASRILRQNLVWAIVYNAVALPAAVLGYIDPLIAVFAMAASTLSVSLNSLRLLRSEPWLSSQID